MLPAPNRTLKILRVREFFQGLDQNGGYFAFCIFATFRRYTKKNCAERKCFGAKFSSFLVSINQRFRTKLI